MLPATLQFLIAMIACAINERMQRKLDYTQEEVRVLKEILVALTGNGRISFTADQRRRLAVAGKALSPEERKKCCQIVKPGTILGWLRQLSLAPRRPSQLLSPGGGLTRGDGFRDRKGEASQGQGPRGESNTRAPRTN